MKKHFKKNTKFHYAKASHVLTATFCRLKLCANKTKINVVSTLSMKKCKTKSAFGLWSMLNSPASPYVHLPSMTLDSSISWNLASLYDTCAIMRAGAVITQIRQEMAQILWCWCLWMALAMTWIARAQKELTPSLQFKHLHRQMWCRDWSHMYFIATV